MDKRSLLFLVAFTFAFFALNFYFAQQDQERNRQWVQQQQHKKAEEQRALATESAAHPVAARKDKNATTKKEERFYVLENDYQQLVFSNHGGALVEINLPLQSATHPRSVVKEIEFDRDMVEQAPANALFPATPYYTPAKEKKSEPFEFHQKGSLGGYYPLLRRTLTEEKEKKSIAIPPSFYGLNITSDYPEVAELIYEVIAFDKHSITFEAEQGHRKITKTFSFESSNIDAPYCFNLSIEIEGDSHGLWLTSGVPDVEWISGGPAPALKYRLMRHQKPEVENLALPQDSMTVTSIHPNWICNSNGFLGIIMQPLSAIDAGYKASRVAGTLVPSRLLAIDFIYQRFQAANLPGYLVALPLKSSSTLSSAQFRVYAGPFADSVLSAVDNAFSNPITGENPDYIASQSFHGWFSFISEPFADFLLILMNFFHWLTHSWALSIILLTIALRVMLYPLTAWSTKSMVKTQQIAPKVTALQEKYKKDPKKAQMEIINLYREEKINPLSGCLPLLIQMPFLIGMFDLLKSTFELRGATFIPGWIDNLTAPDVLFRWNYPLFFIGNGFHLLPILLGAAMFLQQRFFAPQPASTAPLTEQQKQQRTMGSVMTVVFTVMFYHFPSGLNIYWISSTLLGILQQWLMTKKLQRQRSLK